MASPRARGNHAGDTNVDIDASVAPRNARRGHCWRMFAVLTGQCANRDHAQSASRAQTTAFISRARSRSPIWRGGSMDEWAMRRALSERVSAVFIDVPGEFTVLSRRLASRPDFQRRMMMLARLMTAERMLVLPQSQASLPKIVPNNGPKDACSC
jgi:hypothetical protein